MRLSHLGNVLMCSVLHAFECISISLVVKVLSVQIVGKRKPLMVNWLPNLRSKQQRITGGTRGT